MKIINKLLNRFAADGIFLGVWNLVARAGRNIRSRFYAYILDAPGLDIGGGLHLKGSKRFIFGRNVSIFKNCWIEAVTLHNGTNYSPRIRIGDRVNLSNGVHIACIDRIDIGCDVLIGSNVHISDHNHGSYSGALQSTPDQAPAKRALHSSGVVVIEDNVWIGDNVNIMGPVTVGRGAIIGSNSVVRGNVAANTIVAGIPARAIKAYDATLGTWQRISR